MTDERLAHIRELAERPGPAEWFATSVALPELLTLLDEQKKRIEELEGQLRSVDEVLSRRPALADLPDRGAKIEKSISVASSADRWKSRCESAERGRDDAEARASRAEQAWKEAPSLQVVARSIRALEGTPVEFPLAKKLSDVLREIEAVEGEK